MGTVDREHLRALVKASDKSARAHSLDAGLGATAIKDILSGKSRDPGTDTLSKIAAQLGVGLDTLLEANGETATRRAQIVPRALPVRYRVQAGLWYEVDNHSQFELRDDERQLYESQGAVVPHGRYAEWPQWLEIISGDSINLKAPDGTLAHVVDALEMGYEAASGDWVVVERRRAQGGLRERTVKQVEIVKGKVRLMPRSSNPKWADPVNYLNGNANQNDEIEVEIVGKVIGFYLTA
jgi:transcriptional regulator with XRE-family HTH domain